MPKSTKQILIEAAELIDEKGKAVGTYYDPEPDCFCTIGAIGKASGVPVENSFSPWWEHSSVMQAADALRKHLHFQKEEGVDPFHLIFRWNDDPSNSAPDIADAMRKAVEGL